MLIEARCLEKQQNPYFKILLDSCDYFSAQVEQSQTLDFDLRKLKNFFSPQSTNKLHINGLYIHHTCVNSGNMIICVHVNIECFILKAEVNHDSVLVD